MANEHSGHRARVRKQILQNGFDHLEDHELLEFILFYTFAQKDTNELAHKIINHFNGFSNVMEASPLELMKIDGIGESAALLISSLLNASKRYFTQTSISSAQVFDSKSAKKYIASLCLGNKYECLYCIFLDKHKHFLSHKKIEEGSLDSITIYTEKIVEAALLHKAYYVIIGHNHPGRCVTPSVSDIVNTEKIQNALLNINRYLADSIIVSGLKAYSFSEYGIIRNNTVVNIYDKPQNFIG